MTKDQLNKYIEQIVLKEVREQVPLIVRDVMSKMLMEVAVGGNQPVQNNSHKRRSLQEASYGHADELDEYPTMRPKPDGKRFAQLMELSGGPAGDPNGIIVAEGLTEHGTAYPVDPNSLPDHVVHALSRDYRDVMKALKDRTNG
jgi:hypothetical protein